jgi:hypothetical protein
MMVEERATRTNGRPSLAVIIGLPIMIKEAGNDLGHRFYEAFRDLPRSENDSV